MMKTARAGLFAIIAWAAGQASSHAAVCPPSASLRGPEAEVRAVTAHLRADRVLVGAGACPGATVEVTLSRLEARSGLSLHIRDAYGRVSERQVVDDRTAASVIESWVMVDQDADLIAPPAAPVSLPSPPAIAAAPPPPAPPEVRWRLTGAIEAAAAGDGSAWYGGQVTGCRVWGPACLGGRARVSRDFGLGPPSENADVTRTAIEGMLVAALPIWSGALKITPTVGLGAGWMRTSDPSALPGRTVHRDDIGLRTEASVEAAVPVGARFSLVGLVGVGWGRYGAVVSGPADAAATLPDAPVSYLRAGFGCEYDR